MSKLSASEPRMYSFFVLYFLSDHKELSGYELAKLIKERTRGYFSATAGNIYPALKDLEENGLVLSSKPVGKRKKTFYKITSEGSKALLETAKHYKERLERITAFFDDVIEKSK